MTLSKADEVGGSVRVISRSMAVTSIVRKKHQSPGPAKSVQGKTRQAWPDDSDILAALTKMTRNKGRSDESVIDRMKGILQVRRFAFGFINLVHDLYRCMLLQYAFTICYLWICLSF